MNKITRKGATVEIAISKALQELNVTRDEVEIDIVDEGKKGFLGIGARDAEVSVSLKQQNSLLKNEEMQPEEPVQPSDPVIAEPIEESNPLEETIEEDRSAGEMNVNGDEEAIRDTEAYLTAIAKDMGIHDLKIEHEMEGKYISFQMQSEKAAFLIGKRGQTLNALQQLAQLVTNKKAGQFKVVRLDVGDYRQRREQSLEQLAERMADQAVRTGRKVQLEPMPSYERKVIHNALSNRLDIETYSEGTDPNRYLVIEPLY
ncbi:RNA-binding cell elongation regulator Jag/EloR [Sporosarcina contaminans]|uniref:RNA-binding protein KhpB n=1 Tax=Sporosarcina contaminans TaxID=633403 RepID=A0ABW3TU82_9BACL